MLFVMSQFAFFKDVYLVVGVQPWSVNTEQIFMKAKSQNPDYLYVNDADVAPPNDAILTLMRDELDIVVSPVWMYTPTSNCLHLNVSRNGTSEILRMPGKYGVEPIRAASMCSMLISRHVLDAFEKAGEMYTVWSPLIDEGLRSVSPDVVFCEKAQALGFKIYVNWDIKDTVHHKYVDISESTVNEIAIGALHEKRVGHGERAELKDGSDKS